MTAVSARRGQVWSFVLVVNPLTATLKGKFNILLPVQLRMFNSEKFTLMCVFSRELERFTSVQSKLGSVQNWWTECINYHLLT